MIDPATVDMPAVRRIKSSLLVSFDKYGLIKSGASTCPTNTFAAAPRPIGPPILKSF